MRRHLSAGEFLEEILTTRFRGDDRIGAVVRELFDGVPLDFPIILTDRLPLDLQRRRMIGVTFGGKVWILSSYLDRPAVRLLTLLRHEAEHVEQQRRDPLLFYPRYGLSWLCNILGARPPQGATGLRAGGTARAHAAYRAIIDERKAYAAGNRFRSRLIRRLKRLGIDPGNF